MANTLLGLQGVVYGTIGDAQIIVENIRETFSGSLTANYYPDFS